MCLGIPGKVTAIDSEASPRTGVVDFGGIRKSVCLAYVPETEIGDYVVVHVGFAISRLDEAEALRTLEVLTAMPDVFSQELGPFDAPTGTPREPA